MWKSYEQYYRGTHVNDLSHVRPPHKTKRVSSLQISYADSKRAYIHVDGTWYPLVSISNELFETALYGSPLTGDDKQLPYDHVTKWYLVNTHSVQLKKGEC